MASGYTKNGSAPGGYTVGGQPMTGYTVGGHAAGGYTIGGQPQHYTGGGEAVPTPHPSAFQVAVTRGHAGQQDQGNVFSNAVEQGFGVLTNIPNAAVSLPGTLEHTFWSKQGLTESVGTALHDPHSLYGQTYMPVAADVNAAKRGDWHYFEKNPLNPILDIATLASVGGVGALKLGATGRLGEYAQNIATTERLIRDGDKAEALNQARTLQGRIVQRIYDQWRMQPEHADLPVVGANRTIAKILNRREANNQVRMHIPVRDFQRITAKLTPWEKDAVHIIAEPVPLNLRIAYYKARELEIVAKIERGGRSRLKRPPKTHGRIPPNLRAVRQYLAMITDPRVRDAIENPSPELIKAVWAAHDLEKHATENLVRNGVVTQEGHDIRVQMPADEMLAPPPPSVPPGAPTGAAPSPPSGPMLGPPTPPWLGGSTRPPSVIPGEEPTFVMRVPRLFYSEHRGRGLPEGVRSEPLKPRGDIIPVRMNEAGMRHLLRDAKKVNTSTARATVRKIEGQMHLFDEARDRAEAQLSWRRDPQSGSSYVPGSDYHIDTVAKTGERAAYKGQEPLGVFHELPEAKRAVENDARHRRNMELAQQRAAQEAEKPGLSADSFTEGPPAAPARAVPHELEQRIADIGKALDAAEQRMMIAKDPDELAKLHSQTERWRREQNQLIEEALGLPPISGGSLGSLRNVHGDAYPPNFRWPHKRTGVAAGDFLPKGIERGLGKVKILGQAKRNTRYLLQNALYLTDPEQVIASDYLSTLRWGALMNLQREALDPLSRELNVDEPGTEYGKKPGEWYFRPSYDRKTTAPLHPDVKYDPTMRADRLSMSREASRKLMDEHKNSIVSEDQPLKLMTDTERADFEKAEAAVPVDERERWVVERMKEMGIRRVAASYGKDFSKEFGGTHAAVRYLIDRPLDAWRVLTLNYRPAWAVNNLVGNALMGLSRYGVPGAAAYLRVLFHTERGPEKVIRLWRWTEGKPGLRNKWAAAFRESGIKIPGVLVRQRVWGEAMVEKAPWTKSAGLYGTQSRITHGGVYEGWGENYVARVRDNRAFKAVGLTARGVTYPIRAVARGIVRIELLLAEDTSRQAALLVELGGDIAKVKAVARAAGEANLSLIDAFRRIDDPKAVELATQRMEGFLGNFNDLNGVERAFIRRNIPFYSWFKVITKVTARYAATYPGRVLLLKNIEQALNTEGEPPLPSWLAGSVLIGGPSGKGVQTLLSTQGLNPYETLPQIAQGGLGGILNPYAVAPVIGMTGRNPAFGSLQDYHGTGATSRAGWPGFVERTLGAFYGGLAPIRVEQQTTGPYQGKLYSPKTYARVGVDGHNLSVNDFLLQFLGLPIRHVNTAEARRERGLR